MWTRIVLMPFWARVLAAAGVFALLKAVDWCAHGLAADAQSPWWVPVVGIVLGMVVFGVLVAAFTDNSHLAFNNALAGLDPAQRSAAVGVSFRGPVPVDAPVRDAAIRVAQRRLQSALFWKAICLALLCIAGLCVIAGLANETLPSGWVHEHWTTLPSGYLLGSLIDAAVILCFTAAAWYVSLSVKRRLQALR
jgi:hypothetical protein